MTPLSPEFVDIYTRKQYKNTKEENHFLQCEGDLMPLHIQKTDGQSTFMCVAFHNLY